MGTCCIDWQHTEIVLGRFGTRRRAARKPYRAFICVHACAESVELSGGGLIRSYGGWEAVKKIRCEHETKIGEERILGDSDFVQQVIALQRIIKNAN